MSGPAYRIETERALLRCWCPADAPRVRESLDASDAHLRPWIPFMKAEPRTLERSMDWLRGRRAWFDRDEHYCYGAFDPEGEALLGECMLLRRDDPEALEVGYWIDVRHAGRGLATELAAALVRIAFAVAGVRRVDLCCGTGNRASAAIPAKLGFRHDATLRGRGVDSEGERYELMVWSLLAEELSDSPARDAAVRAFDGMGRELELEAAGRG